jgi:hypothetical protein
MDIEGMCEGKKPILFSGRADQGNTADVPPREDDDVDSSERDLDSAPRGAAIWSIRQLTDYWNALGGLFAESLSTQRHKQCYYQIIPPVDLSIDELKSLYEAEEEQYEPLKVFLRTDPVYSKEAERFIETFRTAEELGCDVHVIIPKIHKTNKALKDLGCGDLPGDVTGTQPNVTPVFTHSPDYRTVYYRGQQFFLSPLQAHAVQVMHEHHQRGTFVLSNDFILAEIGSKATLLRAVFKKNPEAWKALIFSPKKGMYSLNIPK